MNKIYKINFEDVGVNTSHRKAEKELIQNYNSTQDTTERKKLLLQIFSEVDPNTVIISPISVEDGHNVRLGRKVFFNQGVKIVAAAPVDIGHHTLIGPFVQIITSTHPTDPIERQRWAYWAKPISIGENVWIGASAIICPGVTIGDHSVIAAGAVVTRDIPRCSLVLGNPGQVVKKFNEPDPKILYELNP